MRNVPEALLRGEALIPSLISGILCTWLLLSATPWGGCRGRPESAVWKERPEQWEKLGPAETLGSTVPCSPLWPLPREASWLSWQWQ